MVKEVKTNLTLKSGLYGSRINCLQVNEMQDEMEGANGRIDKNMTEL